MPKPTQYDAAIVGTGPGGYVAAIRCAQLGLRTAVIERESLGGVCLNWGCIPTKALLESARLFDEIKRAGEFGIVCEPPKPDWKAIVERSRDASTQMSKGVEFLMKKNKIEVVKGTARIVGRGEIVVEEGRPPLNPPLQTAEGETGSPTDGTAGETVVKARNIIIAAGARAKELPGLEIDGKHIVSYRQAMVLDKIPKRLLVIGAGAIGVEFSWFYSVMGAEVTLVELMDQITPLEDKEVAATLARSFKKQGIKVLTSSKVVDIKRRKRGAWGYKVENSKGAQEIDVDVCLLSVGVQANTENLGLEAVNATTDRGFIMTDSRKRTNVPGIYAIGDVSGPPMLAHVASHEGIVAAETIAGMDVPGMDYDNIPACTYCHPQIASTGMSEEKAKEAGYDVKVGKYLFRANGRAVAGGETDGFVKFVTDAKYGEVLGVHIIGPGAPELIGEVVLGREFELTARSIAHTIHAHPTLSEAIMEAAGDSFGEAVHK